MTTSLLNQLPIITNDPSSHNQYPNLNQQLASALLSRENITAPTNEAIGLYLNDLKVREILSQLSKDQLRIIKSKLINFDTSEPVLAKVSIEILSLTDIQQTKSLRDWLKEQNLAVHSESEYLINLKIHSFYEDNYNPHDGLKTSLTLPLATTKRVDTFYTLKTNTKTDASNNAQAHLRNMANEYILNRLSHFTPMETPSNTYFDMMAIVNTTFEALEGQEERVLKVLKSLYKGLPLITAKTTSITVRTALQDIRKLGLEPIKELNLDLLRLLLKTDTDGVAKQLFRSGSKGCYYKIALVLVGELNRPSYIKIAKCTDDINNDLDIVAKLTLPSLVLTPSEYFDESDSIGNRLLTTNDNTAYNIVNLIHECEQ